MFRLFTSFVSQGTVIKPVYCNKNDWLSSKVVPDNTVDFRRKSVIVHRISGAFPNTFSMVNFLWEFATFNCLVTGFTYKIIVFIKPVHTKVKTFKMLMRIMLLYFLEHCYNRPVGTSTYIYYSD